MATGTSQVVVISGRVFSSDNACVGISKKSGGSASSASRTSCVSFFFSVSLLALCLSFSLLSNKGCDVFLAEPFVVFPRHYVEVRKYQRKKSTSSSMPSVNTLGFPFCNCSSLVETALASLEESCFCESTD